MIAFIPCRSGSKSVKDKNIRLLNGKPLLVYTIEQAFKAGITRVIVNSDSQRYLDIAKEAGAETMLRPVELAKDNTSMFEVLKSEIFKIDPLPEIVVLLSATVPFRKPVLIKTAISFFVNNLENYDSLMTVQKVPNEFNPAQVIVLTSLGLKMADGRQISNRITRRQEYPNSYVTSQGIYILKMSNLKNVSLYGKRTMLLECDKSLDINTEEDFKEAEEYLKSKQCKL
jgi:N-acylneuraminate cytidylyltransferase